MAALAVLPPGIEPEWVTVPQALLLSNLGKTLLFELIANGTLESCKVGRRRLIRYQSIRDLNRRAAA